MLNLTGYNMETGITVAMEADVKEMGSAVFPARLFGEIVRKMPEDQITVMVDDNYKTKIVSGLSRFSIMAGAADEYPKLPDVEYDKGIYVPQNLLKDLISGTIFAVSESQARPIQTGCKFEIEPETITVIAVDGYRLALRREKIDNPENRQLSFVCPSPALREVEKILEDVEDDCVFTLGTRHIMFQVGRATLVCRLLEGEFLDWRRVVPTDNPIRLAVNVKEFTESLERVNLIVSEKMKSPVRCTFGDNVVSMITNTTLGRASDEVSVEGDGENLEIGFNNKYLLDALKAAPADEICIRLNTGITPCVVLPTGNSRNFVYMILPVRLKANEN